MADDAVKTLYVVGRGKFPAFLLAQEQCWPLDAANAARMEEPELTMFETIAGAKFRAIALCSFKEPSVSKWSETGWSCGRKGQWQYQDWLAANEKAELQRA